jgi:hypothetical protein
MALFIQRVKVYRLLKFNACVLRQYGVAVSKKKELKYLERACL